MCLHLMWQRPEEVGPSVSEAGGNSIEQRDPLRKVFEDAAADRIWSSAVQGPGNGSDILTVAFRKRAQLPVRIRCTLTAARSTRASSPGAAVSCNPKGK